MAWVALFFAGLFEIGWALGLKHSEGFTKLIPSVITVFFMILSFWLLAFAMKTLPMGTAYAIWTGIGAVGIFICGVIFFNEPLAVVRVVSVLLIVSGIIGLKLSA